MGVSILLTPGPVGRNFGSQSNIAPGWRSQAAAVIRSTFGSSPLTLFENDVAELRQLAAGASVYVADSENMWKKIADAVEEHGAVTIVMQY